MTTGHKITKNYVKSKHDQLSIDPLFIIITITASKGRQVGVRNYDCIWNMNVRLLSNFLLGINFWEVYKVSVKYKKHKLILYYFYFAIFFNKIENLKINNIFSKL